MTVVVHSDGAMGELVSGIGYVIEGDVSISGKRILEGDYTSMEVEFFALVEALRVASIESSSREYCTAYSDAKPLVDKMCGDERCSGDWLDYRKSAERLFDKFDGHELKHCARSENEEAHRLAREALYAGRDERRKT